MDQSSFDRIARLLGGAATRRAGLRSALGTIADTVTISSNDGPAAGGICHRKQYDGSIGTLTVTGGSVVTGNTSTSGFQCATVPESGSSTDVPGCVWP